jgi:hypothetical protein
MAKNNPNSPTDDEVEKASHVYDLNEEDLGIKVGTYPFLCVSAEETVSNSGNAQLMLEFKMTTVNNRTQKMWISLLPQARWKLVATCKAFGIEPGEDKKLRFEMEDFEDVLVSGKVVMDDYSGIPQPKLNAVFPATKAMLEEHAGSGSTPG